MKQITQKYDNFLSVSTVGEMRDSVDMLFMSLFYKGGA